MRKIPLLAIAILLMIGPGCGTAIQGGRRLVEAAISSATDDDKSTRLQRKCDALRERGIPAGQMPAAC